jgi:hypothetical protein
MSTLRLAQNNRHASAARPALSIANFRDSRPGVFIGGAVVVGALTIALLNLLLTILTSNAVYELSAIQKEKKELTTTTQILSEEVDSLSSQQNLANAAAKLGMISNANPVFLRLSDQKVFGKPKAALNADGRVARNLVPNSALVQQSNAAELIAAEDATLTKAATPIATGLTGVTTAPTALAAGVVKGVSAATQVVSSGAVIPASPTH